MHDRSPDDSVPLSAGLIELAVIGWGLWGCLAYAIVLVWRAVWP